MWSAVLAWSLAVAPTTTCAPDDTVAARLGPAQGPAAVHAYLDPADHDALRTWVGLRALATERPDLAIDVHLAEPNPDDDPQRAKVRAWAWVGARRGHLTALLRLLAADDWEWVAARVHTKAGRAELAARLHVDAAQAWAPTQCAHDHVVADGEAVAEHFRRFGNPVFRLPVFVIDDVVFDDPPGLARVRTELARRGERARDAIDPRLRAPAPSLKATSARMRRPAIDGVLLGGPGLPHRFVLMARDDEDPNLSMLLPPLLQYRVDNPGQLSITIAARGSSIGAMALRHRLCAADRLGLTMAYVKVLTLPLPRDKTARPPDVQALIKRLDDYPAPECAGQTDPAQLDLPDGAWLDGLPRTRAELGNLPATLLLLDAATRPLEPFVAPSTDEP